MNPTQPQQKAGSMRMFKAALGLVATTTMLVLAPTAGAATYADNVVAKFGPQQHVVADPAAKPPLNNVSGLNSQILGSRYQKIYVAAVAANQTGQTGPDQIDQALIARNGKFDGVIVVIDSRGYHVKGYDIDSAVAAKLDPPGQSPLINQEAAQHKNDPAGTVGAFIGALSTVQLSAPGQQTTTTTTRTTTQPHRPSYAWVWWLIAAVVAAVIVAVIITLMRASRKRKQQHQNDLDEVESDLINTRPGVDRLGRSGIDVNDEYVDANVAHGNAKTAWEKGQVAKARAELSVVKDAIRRGDAKLNPTPTRASSSGGGGGGFSGGGTMTATAAPAQHQPKQARVQATNPQGTTINIDNSNYRSSPQPGYGYFNPTPRYYNGMFFDVGYFPYDPWNWGMNSWALGAVMYENAVLRDDLYYGGAGYGYGGGFGDGYGDGVDTTTTTETTTTYDGGNDSGQDDNWNQTQESDSGFDGGQSTGGDDAGYDDSGQQDTQQSTSGFDGGGQTYDGGSSGFGGDGGSQSYDGGSSGYDGGSSGFDGGGGGFDGGGSDFGGGGGGGDFGF